MRCRHVGFFPKGLANDFGQNFKFPQSWCMFKLDLEMMFLDVLESN